MEQVVPGTGLHSYQTITYIVHVQCYTIAGCISPVKVGQPAKLLYFFLIGWATVLYL